MSKLASKVIEEITCHRAVMEPGKLTLRAPHAEAEFKDSLLVAMIWKSGGYAEVRKLCLSQPKAYDKAVCNRLIERGWLKRVGKVVAFADDQLVAGRGPYVNIEELQAAVDVGSGLFYIDRIKGGSPEHYLMFQLAEEGKVRDPSLGLIAYRGDANKPCPEAIRLLTPTHT